MQRNFRLKIKKKKGKKVKKIRAQRYYRMLNLEDVHKHKFKKVTHN